MRLYFQTKKKKKKKPRLTFNGQHFNQKQIRTLLPHEAFCSIVYQTLWMFVQFYTCYQRSFQGVKRLKIQCKTRQIKQKRAHHWLSDLNLLQLVSYLNKTF